MTNIRIGISAWSDRSLVESDFYPGQVNTPAARLQYYSSQFSVAELDASYHFFPTERLLSFGLDNTPPGFKFDVKAYSLFTGHPTRLEALPRRTREAYRERITAKGNVYSHHLPAAALDELWQGFTVIMRQIAAAGKLGAVCFQFPTWFHFSPENRDYIRQCRERLDGLPLAVEFRVGSWLEESHREETLALLRDNRIAPVCVDEPQGLPSSVLPLAEVTAPPGIIRFHGRNRETWERSDVAGDERFRYLYTELELREWLPRIAAMSAKVGELHLIFKNKHGDFPVANARQMGRLLGLAPFS